MKHAFDIDESSQMTMDKFMESILQERWEKFESYKKDRDAFARKILNDDDFPKDVTIIPIWENLAIIYARGFRLICAYAPHGKIQWSYFIKNRGRGLEGLFLEETWSKPCDSFKDVILPARKRRWWDPGLKKALKLVKRDELDEMRKLDLA